MRGVEWVCSILKSLIPLSLEAKTSFVFWSLPAGKEYWEAGCSGNAFQRTGRFECYILIKVG